MKKILLSLSIVLSAGAAFSQTYNSPESIEFDYANNRWLIANDNAGNILARSSSTGALTIFATGLTGPHGIEIIGNTLYVCDGGKMKGYDLTTAAQVMNLNLGATFLNGLAHDNNGNLYATDFTAKKIYRINSVTQQFNVFVTGLAKSPNGIIYDQPNNRCVFVNWGTNAPIMAVSLVDSTTSTLTATTLGNCDGIAKDAAGNYFVSSWNLNGVSKFNNTFSAAPTTVITGLNSPADIFYNTLTDTLGVPNSGTSGTSTYTNKTSYHYMGSATGITEEVAKSNLSMSVNPNPVVKTAEINYELQNECKVTIRLFDIKGTLIKTIADETQGQGKQTTFFSKSNLAAGTYFLTITTASQKETRKIIIAE
ncbi:MAG: hypothetical protein JWP12_2299 [Bacteroidetes bacterium]|nr:hypothetical protein [Bacteroidota bacterium]